MLDTRQAITCEGDLYYKQIVNGAVVPGLKLFGNTIQITINSAVQEQMVRSRGRDNGGQVLAAAYRTNDSTVAIRGNTFTADILAMWNLGTSAALNGAGGSVVDEPATATLDSWVDLVHRDLSNVSVTNAAKDVTYVLDTDYEVNTRLGWIYPLSTGAIIEGQDILVNYDWAAESGTVISGGTKQIVPVSLFFDGKNIVDDSKVYITIPHATLSRDQEMDAAMEGFWEYGLSGRIITPGGASQGYTIETELM